MVFTIIYFNVNLLTTMFSLPTVFGLYAWRTNIIGAVLGFP